MFLSTAFGSQTPRDAAAGSSALTVGAFVDEDVGSAGLSGETGAALEAEASPSLPTPKSDHGNACPSVMRYTSRSRWLDSFNAASAACVAGRSCELVGR